MDNLKNLSDDELIEVFKKSSPVYKPPSMVSGLAEDAKGYYQSLHEPTEPATSAKDFATRVLPESLGKTAVGMVEYPYHLAKSFTDPLLTKKPLSGMKDALLSNIDTIARGTGEPIGLYGLKALKERWLSDPVGSALGIMPLLSGLKLKKVKPILEEHAKTGKPISEIIDISPEIIDKHIRNKSTEELINIVEQTKPKPVETPVMPTPTEITEGIKPFKTDVINKPIEPIQPKGAVERAQGYGKSERDIAKAKTIQDEMSHPDYNKYGDVKELYYGRVYDLRFANPDDISNINKDIAKNYKELGLNKDANTTNPNVMMRVLDKRVGDYTGVIGSDGKYYPSELMFGKEFIEEPKEVIERGQGQGYGQATEGQVAPTETRVLPEEQAATTALQPGASPAMAATPPVTTPAIKESLVETSAEAPNSKKYWILAKQQQAILKNPNWGKRTTEGLDLHKKYMDLEEELEFHRPVVIAEAQIEIDKEKNKTKQIEPIREQKDTQMEEFLDPYRIASKAKFNGIDRLSSYSEYVKAYLIAGAKLKLNAVEFYKIYDKVGKYDYEVPKESLMVEPVTAEVKSTQSNIHKARDARKQNILKAKAPEIDKVLSEGGHVEIAQVIDKATINKLNKEYDLLRRDAPIGNKEHPIMKRLVEISGLLKEVPKKHEYRLFYDKGTFVDITKTEYDYAIGQTKKEQAKPVLAEALKEPAIKESLKVEPATKSIAGLKEPGSKPAEEVKPVKTKPYPLRVPGLNDVVEGEYQGNPYHTDGNMILLSKPKIKPKDFKQVTEEQKTSMQNVLGDFLKSNEELHIINKITFQSFGKSAISSDNPIKKANKDSMVVVYLNTGDVSTTINQDYYNYVKKHYPDAEFRISKEPESPVLVYNNNEVVGSVMPLNEESRIKSPSVDIKETPELYRNGAVVDPSIREPHGQPLGNKIYTYRIFDHSTNKHVLIKAYPIELKGFESDKYFIHKNPISNNWKITAGLQTEKAQGATKQKAIDNFYKFRQKSVK